MTLTPHEEAALSWHLSANVYPPEDFMYDAAVAAIAYVRNGLTNPEAPKEGYVPAPLELTGREGGWIPAHEVIENLKLDFFLDDLEVE